MSGSATFPASATYKSVNDDNYSLRPGVSQQQVAKSCENSIDAWSKEEFHNDNFEHTTSTTFSPSNFKTEVRHCPTAGRRQERQRSRFPSPTLGPRRRLPWSFGVTTWSRPASFH